MTIDRMVFWYVHGTLPKPYNMLYGTSFGKVLHFMWVKNAFGQTYAGKIE